MFGPEATAICLAITEGTLIRALQPTRAHVSYDVAVDLRAGSATYGRWCGTELTGEGGETPFIPAGFSHGFCTLQDDTLVAYKVDSFYDRAAEGGIRFDDPDLAIGWPVPAGAIITSAKDAALPRLRDAATPFDFVGPAA